VSNNLVVVTGAKKDLPPAEGFAGLVAIASGLSLPFADGRYESIRYRVQLQTEDATPVVLALPFLTPVALQSAGALRIVAIRKLASDASSQNTSQLYRGFARGVSGNAQLTGSTTDYSYTSGVAPGFTPALASSGPDVTLTITGNAATVIDWDLFIEISTSAVPVL
jgi:hypothetical protein